MPLLEYLRGLTLLPCDESASGSALLPRLLSHLSLLIFAFSSSHCLPCCLPPPHQGEVLLNPCEQGERNGEINAANQTRQKKQMNLIRSASSKDDIKPVRNSDSDLGIFDQLCRSFSLYCAFITLDKIKSVPATIFQKRRKPLSPHHSLKLEHIKPGKEAANVTGVCC